MATTEPRLMTAEDLWNLPNDGMRHELVRGVLRSMPPAGGEHGWITGDVDSPLRAHVRANGLGVVMVGDIGFKLATEPDLVRAPDVAFVSRERLPAMGDLTKFLNGAPDLAVEVVSPSDLYSEVAEKVAEWLQYGTRLVLVVDPRRRVVAVHRPGQPVRELGEADTIDGADVVPGWRLPVRAVFAGPLGAPGV